MKIKFKDIPKDIKKAVQKAEIQKSIRFYPVFVLYGLTLIGFIKLLDILL